MKYKLKHNASFSIVLKVIDYSFQSFLKYNFFLKSYSQNCLVNEIPLRVQKEFIRLNILSTLPVFDGIIEAKWTRPSMEGYVLARIFSCIFSNWRA